MTRSGTPDHGVVDELAAWIDQQPQLLGNVWVSSLEPRKREEAAFHDLDREGDRDLARESSPNRRFYDAADVVADHVKPWMQVQAPGKAFLDYACGNGLLTLLAAHAGAPLAVGIDISAGSVANCHRRAEVAGLADRVRFLQRDCSTSAIRRDCFGSCEFAVSHPAGSRHPVSLPSRK